MGEAEEGLLLGVGEGEGFEGAEDNGVCGGLEDGEMGVCVDERRGGMVEGDGRDKR